MLYFRSKGSIRAMKTESVIEHIVGWLSDYARNSGTRGFVVGVSGGIDSAVTSALCARTGLPVICVAMPIHQSNAQVSRAKEHIDMLCDSHPAVSHQELNLTATFDQFIQGLPPVGDSELHDLSLANARARLRMTAMYYLAGIDKMLVVGTGNKIEDFGVGFYTKYGDGGVDISPIADLLKSEVYELGSALGVSERILSAAPTDGLWGDDRTDEDQIGASYPELEWAMHESEVGGEIEDYAGREREVMGIYRRLNQANRHKMVPIPVCIIPDELR